MGLSIADALGGYLASRGLAEVGMLAALTACWPAAAGEELAAHARPLRLSDDVLVVAVDHPSYVVALELEAARLLAALAACCGRPVANRMKVTVRGTLGLE